MNCDAYLESGDLLGLQTCLLVLDVPGPPSGSGNCVEECMIGSGNDEETCNRLCGDIGPPRIDPATGNPTWTVTGTGSLPTGFPWLLLVLLLLLLYYSQRKG